MSLVTNLKMMKNLAKKLSPRLLLSITSVRPRQDLNTKVISEMDSHKGNEESKKISFTTGGSESNGNTADKIFGAKRQAQVPHNKILTAETIKSLQTQPLLRNEHSAWIMKRIDQIQIKPRA